MFAEAVLDAASDMTIATAVNRTVNAAGDFAGNQPVMPWPIASASPVENASSPIARPPPNSRMIPQSIRTASSQLRVNLRARQLTGRRNSRMAPEIAATDSGTATANPRARLELPNPTIVRTPGAIQSVTVTPNA